MLEEIFSPVVLLKYGTVYPQIGLILVHLVVFVVHCKTSALSWQLSNYNAVFAKFLQCFVMQCNVSTRTLAVSRAYFATIHKGSYQCLLGLAVLLIVTVIVNYFLASLI